MFRRGGGRSKRCLRDWMTTRDRQVKVNAIVMTTPVMVDIVNEPLSQLNEKNPGAVWSAASLRSKQYAPRMRTQPTVAPSKPLAGVTPALPAEEAVP